MQYTTRFDSPIPPQSLLSILNKRKKMIITLFVIIAGSISGAGFVFNKVYRATSKVIVRYEDENEKAYLYGNYQSGSRIGYDRLSSEALILKTRSIIEPVVNKLHLDQPEDGRTLAIADQVRAHDEAIEKLMTNIKVEREKDTNVLSVNYEDTNPALAARVVEEVVASYAQQRPTFDRNERAVEFFDQQLDKIKNELNELGTREAEEKHRRQFLSADHQTQILFQELADFDKELTQVRAERISKESKLTVIREQLRKSGDIAIPSTETSDSPSKEDYLTELLKKKLELELKEAYLSEKYKDEYPELANIKAALKTTRSKVRTEVERLVEEEQAGLRALLAEEQALAYKMNQVAGKIADLSHNQLELDKITIGKKDLEQVYSMLIRQREEAKIAQSKQEYMVQVRVIEPAVKPYKPVKPNRPLYIAIGILLGMVVSLGFVLFIESFDHSLNTAEDAQNALGLPILASISEIGAASRARYMITDSEEWRNRKTWNTEKEKIKEDMQEVE